MSNGFLLFVDCETTGLPPRPLPHFQEFRLWPRLVSVSWILCHADGTQIHRADSIVLPEGFTVPLSATQVHGITNDLALALGEERRDVLRRFLSAAAQEPLLVAHNVEFDWNVIRSEFTRDDLPVPDLDTFCTKEAGTALCRIPGLRGRFKWPTLDELHRHLFSAGLDQAHNSAHDVSALRDCFLAMRRNLPEP